MMHSRPPQHHKKWNSIMHCTLLAHYQRGRSWYQFLWYLIRPESKTPLDGCSRRFFAAMQWCGDIGAKCGWKTASVIWHARIFIQLIMWDVRESLNFSTDVSLHKNTFTILDLAVHNEIIKKASQPWQTAWKVAPDLAPKVKVITLIHMKNVYSLVRLNVYFEGISFLYKKHTYTASFYFMASLIRQIDSHSTVRRKINETEKFEFKSWGKSRPGLPIRGHRAWATVPKWNTNFWRAVRWATLGKFKKSCLQPLI
jgi:hypothetical protein